MRTHHLRVVRATDPAGDQLQRLPLHCPHAPDQRLFGHHLTCTRGNKTNIIIFSSTVETGKS